MPSVYDIKPAFQNLLRPLADAFVRAGITPNQVTVAAFILSALGGGVIVLQPTSPWPLLALPVVLFIRMALNALDGMMAREHNLTSPAGAILNEASDVAADAVLYLPLALVPSLNAGAVVTVVVLAGLTELVGLAGATIGASRRYDGPMGKSDRAFGISVLAIAAAVWPTGTPVLTGVLAVIIALEVLTVVNRSRAALEEIEK